MDVRRAGLVSTCAVGVLLIVAGCTGGSDGNGTPSATATTTVTATGSASSAAPPTGSGVPATSTTPVSGGSSSGSTGPGLCTPTVMTFAVGRSDGAAGTGFFSVVATNASSTPCVTTGWPGVAILGSDGRQVAQVERTGAEGSTLTVQPGGKIHAVLSSSDVPTGQDTCTPAATAILFTLPDNTDSTRIDGVSITPCNPQVQAFQAGAG